MNYKDFWVPKEKWQLIMWLANYYEIAFRKKFERMSKKQLYAIYFRIRDDKEKVSLDKKGTVE